MADDIMVAAEEGRRMISIAGEFERAEARPQGRLPGQLGPAIEQFIARCHELGHPLPGRRDNTGALVVNHSHLARLLNTVPEALHAQHRARLAGSGLRRPSLSIGDDQITSGEILNGTLT